MATDNPSKFDRIYWKVYKIFFGVALVFFAICGVEFWIHAKEEKQEIFSWQFSGVVDSIHTPGHAEVYVSINQKEYWLSHYHTGNKLQTSSNGYDFYSFIENGDSLIKQKNKWDLKLIKKNGKVYIFKSDYSN